MMEIYRGWISLGAVVGLLAVAAAAWSAHGAVEPGRLRAVESALQMLGWHALAIVACGLLGARGGWLVHAAGAAYALGVLLFCGAVFVPIWGGPSLGMTAPVGGVLLMLGWVLLGLAPLLR